ncbi:thiol reductant ABC exporter subunit CydD [Streptococcus pseudoporcinus]|uniref:Thiol reductant ABC exporter, CydD subunit n=1 Tax=Streptococcus pseudoporcinus LQ 940-04 TaxID=875093 RepID=G5KA27_9STRE|nr:thiol reductant ABC exporter subunit CydD [Streptococcus pseudoporcinus]EFR43655.1 thiol reductant ABC exporter, CydD subunit [Streptococcus pseudoporcinus SPIN 20026]EHI64547.1 thiol reductant ABC exporter, CydD subunit [Streptococcus pseudoporcinus LQ 940-04]VEF93767.1 thiol reductant ABC exporter, CydD subunit [Streptococcus pseudoporcinus]
MLDKAVMRLSGIHKMLGLLAGLDFLQAIFIIGQAYFLSQAISGLWQGQPLSKQSLAIVSFLLCYLVRHLINFIKDEQLDRFAAKHAQELRSQLLEKLFLLGPQIVQEEGSGNVITMALDGISLVENYLHLVLNKMMNLSVIPFMLLAFIFYMDSESGLILLLVYPLIIIFMIILGLAAKARADKQYASYQVLSNHFLDSLRGIDTLRFFGLSKRYAKSIYRTSESFRKATMSALRIGILSTFALDFFTTLSIAIVAVMLGLRLINEQILLFPALTVLILAPEYFIPVRDFSSDYHATLDGKNAFSAVQRILSHPENTQEQVFIEQWTDKSRLNLDKIQLSYDGNDFMSIPHLELSGIKKVALVGMSGSGKSSLVNLLSGFLAPNSGSFQLDEQNLLNLDQEAWRKQLIYIPQSPYVFEMSLRDNVAFYRPEASLEEIQEAIKVVGLEELVAELPEGLDTRIGNGARPLSGGQAQRIALARAFLDKERRILLFDEPTAHLDLETEIELKARMLPLMANRLVIFATHRLHWLKDMDHIIVLDHGQIVEVGSYSDLIAKKGYLYDLKHAMGGQNA